MPSIGYYKDIDPKDYNNMFTNTWDFKKATITYLKQDLISLHEVLTKVAKSIHRDFSLQLTNNITISSLALNIFTQNFYNPVYKPVPYINNRKIFEDIKNSYYGGMTEVYKPTNENNEKLYYYDVNSLYPSVALNPMPGLECKYVEYLDSFVSLNNGMFGFYYCDITSPTVYLYIGLLPYRNPVNAPGMGLLFPKGN